MVTRCLIANRGPVDFRQTYPKGEVAGIGAIIASGTWQIRVMFFQDLMRQVAFSSLERYYVFQSIHLELVFVQFHS